MSMDNVKWTIQGKRGEATFPIREFATKREAMTAMEADRQPKTEIRKQGHSYIFTMKG